MSPKHLKRQPVHLQEPECQLARKDKNTSQIPPNIKAPVTPTPASSTAAPAAPRGPDTADTADRVDGELSIMAKDTYTYIAKNIDTFDGKPSRNMQALAAQTITRTAEWRDSFDHIRFNLGRAVNFEALQCQVTGVEITPGCKHCNSGHGPWKTCVTSTGFFGRSCANCHYNSDGKRCSFRSAGKRAAPVEFDNDDDGMAAEVSRLVLPKVGRMNRAQRMHRMFTATAMAMETVAAAASTAARLFADLGDDYAEAAGFKPVNWEVTDSEILGEHNEDDVFEGQE